MKTEQELKTAFEKEHGGLSDAYTYEDISDWWLTRLKEDRRAVVEGFIEEIGEDDEPFANTEYSMGVEGGRNQERQRIRQLLTSHLAALDNEEKI